MRATTQPEPAPSIPAADAARVLMVGRDERPTALSEGLDRLGWRTVRARGALGALAALSAHPIEAVLIETEVDPAGAFALAARLRAEMPVRRLPMLALGMLGQDLPGVFDLVLASPVHPQQASLRLESVIRAASAEEELSLRTLTLGERGGAPPPAEPDVSPLRLLAIGEPAPRFLALSHAARARGAEVEGAFTPYTAFDYLHDKAFDAVVLWAGETHAEALSIAGGMRRNTRLYHVPTLLYLRGGANVDAGQAYDRGLSDIADSADSAEDAAERVLALARTYRREAKVRRALERTRASLLMDADTGLFPQDLFAAHLARLAGSTARQDRPLSIVVLRATERSGAAELRRAGWLGRAMPQIGSMIGRLVRMQDTAGRLSADLFALALPNATRPAARAAAQRIAAVIACTAFEAGKRSGPFTIELDVGVATLEQGEGAATALERAAAALASSEPGG